MTEAEWERGRDPVELARSCYSVANVDRKGRMLAIRCLEHLREERGHEIEPDLLDVANRLAENEIGDAERVREFKSLERQLALYQALLNWSGYQAGLQVLAAIGERWGSRRTTPDDLRAYCDFVRDIFGNPFRPVEFSPDWRTSTAVAIANSMYESRDFGPMPLLADALQDAGCEEPEIIDHCRESGPHVRGCWVVDGVLGKG